MKGSILCVSILALILTIPLIAAQQPLPAEGQPILRTFEGELSKIDIATRTITVKSAATPTTPELEMVFVYDDQTEVLGSETGIQALLGNNGARLKINYREQ